MITKAALALAPLPNRDRQGAGLVGLFGGPLPYGRGSEALLGKDA